MFALHLIRRDELLIRKHRSDFRVERIERRCVELRDLGTARAERAVVLGIDQDDDRNVLGMRVAPGLDLLQASDETDACGAEIEIRDVHHLEARLCELGRGGSVEALAERARAERIREAPALRIDVHVQFQLARATVERFGQAAMRVIEQDRGPARTRTQLRHLRVWNRDFVAVVRADAQ